MAGLLSPPKRLQVLPFTLFPFAVDSDNHHLLYSIYTIQYNIISITIYIYIWIGSNATVTFRLSGTKLDKKDFLSKSGR